MTMDRARTRDVPGLEGTAYRLVREIGRGGMGSVHEVQHRALGKLFVMKVLHESLAHREDFALRMQREWRTLARIEHPAIVQVTDAGRTSDGRPFFVMERLEGHTLGDRLARGGPWPAAEAARFMLAVLSGLEAAHRAGAIHRDIKPQNLFLTPRGPKILDFGIVKSRRKGALGMTRSGVAIGTPRYMAPEQAAGLPVDGRADLYACGLVLFEMIAGRDPFSQLKEQAELVGAQISETPPRLDDVCRQAPAPLADLLARWLAKAPEDRPGSARLAQAELEALLPLLDGAAALEARPSPEVTLTLQHGDSTAGATTGSASMPPSNAGAELSAVPGSLETETIPAPGLAREPGSSLAGPGDLSHVPSVTPPPIVPPRRGSASPGRLGVAGLILLSALALGLAALVLTPSPPLLDRSVDLRGRAASYDFHENSPVPAAAAPPLAEGPGLESSADERAAAAPEPAGGPTRPAAERAPNASAERVAEADRAQKAEPLQEPEGVQAVERGQGAGHQRSPVRGPPAGAAPPAPLPGSGLW